MKWPRVTCDVVEQHVGEELRVGEELLLGEPQAGKEICVGQREAA